MIEQTSGETNVTPEGRSLFGMAVPPALAHIADAVEKSRRILDLPDNWDDEGSPGYSRETWERAAHFVLKNALRLWDDRAL